MTHLVVFDIDGTLVQSADFDGRLYARAIRDVLGLAIDTDWCKYENVTDTGILREVLRIDLAGQPAGGRGTCGRAVRAAYPGVSRS